MEALVITGGDAPDREFLRRLAARAGVVIAADSGLSSAVDAGIVPEWAIGDMDSLSDESLLSLLPPDRVLRHAAAKDLTDTELAIEFAAGLGAGRIVLAGGGGGRLDHLLALRALFERKLRPAEWHTARESVHVVLSDSVFKAEAKPGTTVSVFPLSGGASGMESEGLAWSLRGLVWDGGGFGVSNVCTGDRFVVRAGTGDLLVVVARP